MRRLRNSLVFVASAFALLPAAANAAALTIVNVGAPAINCVFNVSCTVVVTDSSSPVAPPGDIGAGFLQSRTYPGTKPAPAAGRMAYEYRLDLTKVSAPVVENCVTKMDISFGPVVKEPYPPGALKDVFVVTSGGLGSVGISSATQVGNVITFVFGTPSSGGVCPGQTSFFFGLTSATTTPVLGTAKLYFSQPPTPSANFAARHP